jgi:phosphatidate phosphatase APP1
MPPLAGGFLRIAVFGVAALLVSRTALSSRDKAEIIVSYGYGTPQRFVLEGRVAELRGGRAAKADDSWLRNLWRTLRALREEELRPQLLLSFASRTWSLSCDDGGYFALRGYTPPPAHPGWNPVVVATVDGTASVKTPVLIVPPEDTIGIISDFDDTVIVSEVGSRPRLLEHSLLENDLQRRPVAGMAAFYRDILARNPLPQAAPVFYLTASPRQLQPGIRSFLERNGFPAGPIVAKKITNETGGDPLLDQEAYKREHIERILADLPDVRFVLVGDDGERDPETYEAIRGGHPGRIEAIFIRRVNADPQRSRYPDQAEPPAR